MLKLELKSAEVDTKSGTSKRGNAYSVRLQRGWLHVPGSYPQLVEFRLRDGQEPFQAGFYEVGPGCYEVDRFRHPVLDLSRASPAK